MNTPQAGKFDPVFAAKGYALNKMCHSLNTAAGRAAFLADEAGYCAGFGVSAEDCAAVMARDKPKLFIAGGNMYFLAKLDRAKKVTV